MYYFKANIYITIAVYKKVLFTKKRVNRGMLLRYSDRFKQSSWTRVSDFFFFFLVNIQIITILGFALRVVSFTEFTELCHEKEVINNT